MNTKAENVKEPIIDGDRQEFMCPIHGSIYLFTEISGRAHRKQVAFTKIFCLYCIVEKLEHAGIKPIKEIIND